MATFCTPITDVLYSSYAFISCFKQGVSLSTMSSPSKTAKGSFPIKLFAQYIACPSPLGSF